MSTVCSATYNTKCTQVLSAYKLFKQDLNVTGAYSCDVLEVRLLSFPGKTPLTKNMGLLQRQWHHIDGENKSLKHFIDISPKT